MSDDTVQQICALIDYRDEYVQPLLLEALESQFPSTRLQLINDESQLPSPTSPYVQWRQYEEINFDNLMSHTTTFMANSYIIRKALIRKHYLASTVSHWLSKNPQSSLSKHVKPSIDFELDFAEFLDDALVEAFELRESFARNEECEAADREWWILKPGMSDRGQGIRLFSTEEELTEIFEAWDPPSDDDESDEVEEGAEESHIDLNEDLDNTSVGTRHNAPSRSLLDRDDGFITSQLRHFVAQPYIHPPLLLTKPHPSANRKFHIRTYVVAVGALKVYVYRPMLALFAGREYSSPSDVANEELQSHLTNTCLQSGEREGSVHTFWSLPETTSGISSGVADWREHVFAQICTITAQVFEAAARSMSIHFQPLPNAFEIFGVDFMVDAQGDTWLLEINAFPDFAQTGGELKDLIARLFRQVVEVAVKPFFGIESDFDASTMSKVLDIDLGRR